MASSGNRSSSSFRKSWRALQISGTQIAQRTTTERKANHQLPSHWRHWRLGWGSSPNPSIQTTNSYLKPEMAFTKLGSSDRRPPGLQTLFEHRPRLVLRRLRRGFHAAPRFQKLQDGPHLASGTQMAKGWSQPSPRKKDGKMWSSSPWKREDPGISQGSLYYFSKKRMWG